HDAPDQRDEQQQVDRGEPGRGEDVEESQGVQDLAPAAVLLEELLRQRRVDAALRVQRAGDGRDRQQHQQDQSGLHAGQLPPQEPQGAPQSQRRGAGRPSPVDLRLAAPAAALLRAARLGGGLRALLVHHTTGSKVEIMACSWLIQLAHTPVIRSTPIAISSAPESRPIVRRCAESFRLTPRARSNSSANSTNGMPRPSEYASERIAPRSTPPSPPSRDSAM